MRKPLLLICSVIVAALALLWRRLTHEEEWECDKHD